MWDLHGGDYLRLEYNDGHRFWFDKEGRHIWALQPDNSDLNEVSEYLLGPVFGIVLRLRGLTCLHASAVSKNGEAMAFVGPPGAGKSTTAALLSRRGYDVMADDITVITRNEGDFIVCPAYPALWLWNDSVEIAYKDAPSKPLLSQNGKKARVIDSEGTCYESRSLPIRKIYILDRRDRTLREQATPKDNFLSLVANTYATNVLDAKARVREFEELEAISQKVSIERLCPSGISEVFSGR